MSGQVGTTSFHVLTTMGWASVPVSFSPMGLLQQWQVRRIGGTLPDLARILFANADGFVWLDSADSEHPTGQRSYIGANMGSGWAGRTCGLDQLPALPLGAADEPSNGPGYQPGYFVALNYECTQALVLVPDVVVVQEHGQLWLYHSYEATLPQELAGQEVAARAGRSAGDPASLGLQAPVPDVRRDQYAAMIARCQELIAAGQCAQLCLTTSWRTTLSDGTLSDDAVLDLYLRLRAQSPTPMASLWNIDNTAFLSASPERFLQVTSDGKVQVNPIKGTRGRGVSPAEDAAIVADLAASKKDFEENRMIVDIMCEDLCQVCRPGSVQVSQLCEVHTFSDAHQLISTVEGQLRPGVGAVDVVQACMPPGSMTGAPKARAVKALHVLEPQRRGWYSGVAGHITADGAADFSVLIRTVVVDGGELSYGVGGAITALSDTAAELEEVEVKLRPFRKLLCF